MVKVTRVSGRGTSRKTTDTYKKSSFAGAAFKKKQEEKRKAIAGKYISTGRGTGRKKVSTTATKSRSTKGVTRVSGRGTSKRKSRG
jgi:hypothetical protein